MYFDVGFILAVTLLIKHCAKSLSELSNELFRLLLVFSVDEYPKVSLPISDLELIKVPLRSQKLARKSKVQLKRDLKMKVGIVNFTVVLRLS